MARRVSLPAADDLFRPTGEAEDAAEGKPRAAAAKPSVRAVPDAAEVEPSTNGASGRIRHDEKMTVYVTSSELLAIEHARLALRGGHSLALDRGRLVREAIAVVLADLDEHGEDSMLVRRLREA